MQLGRRDTLANIRKELHHMVKRKTPVQGMQQDMKRNLRPGAAETQPLRQRGASTRGSGCSNQECSRYLAACGRPRRRVWSGASEPARRRERTPAITAERLSRRAGSARGREPRPAFAPDSSGGCLWLKSGLQDTCSILSTGRRAEQYSQGGGACGGLTHQGRCRARHHRLRLLQCLPGSHGDGGRFESMFLNFVAFPKAWRNMI